MGMHCSLRVLDYMFQTLSTAAIPGGVRAYVVNVFVFKSVNGGKLWTCRRRFAR